MNINLILTIDETQSIINVLGELPTKAGVFPLLMKIVEQANDQTKTSKEELSSK